MRCLPASPCHRHPSTASQAPHSCRPPDEVPGVSASHANIQILHKSAEGWSQAQGCTDTDVMQCVSRQSGARMRAMTRPGDGHRMGRSCPSGRTSRPAPGMAELSCSHIDCRFRCCSQLYSHVEHSWNGHARHRSGGHGSQLRCGSEQAGSSASGHMSESTLAARLCFCNARGEESCCAGWNWRD